MSDFWQIIWILEKSYLDFCVLQNGTKNWNLGFWNNKRILMQTSTGDFSEAPIYKFKIHSTYKSCSSVFPVLFDGLTSSNIDFCSLSSIHDFDHIPPPFWNGTLRKVVKLGKVLASVAEAFYSSIKQAFHEFLTSRLMKKAWKSKYQMIHHTISFVVLIFRIFITGIFIQIKISCFQKRSKDGAESVLLHKNSNKSSNFLLHKPLSAPSFGRFGAPIR